jgi:hypothetical protein
MADLAEKQEALRESVRDASETVFCARNIVGACLSLTLAGVLFAALCRIPRFPTVPDLFPAPLLVGAGVAAAGAAAIRLGTRRPRQLASELPPAAVVTALRPLLMESDEVTRGIAARLLKELPSAETELVPAAPPGRGDEVAAPSPEGCGRELAGGGRSW